MFIYLRQKIRLLLSVFSFMIIVPCAQAAIGSGYMDANIINPLTMDIKIALQWCEENIESVKCDILKEEIETQEYEVLSVNFQ